MSARLLEKIDEICERFEDNQQSDSPRPLEDFLPADWTTSERSELIRHLLSIELEYRTRQGEKFFSSQLVSRFPGLPDVVKEVLVRLPVRHATVSRQAFLQDVEKSQLLSQETLNQVVSSAPTYAGANELAVELVQRNQLTRFQAYAFCHGHSSQLKLGNYWLQDQIGAGGMGEVYKARHHQMQRLVALKVLPASLMQQSAAVRRFEREIVAISRISHPNVVTAYDAGCSNGVHYLVMEYVEGMDLRALVQSKGRLGTSAAIDYVLQAARGLQAAHLAGMVHRDVKPANLLLDATGVVKVLDLGLARLSDPPRGTQSSELSGSGFVVGTPDFMAPEQAENPTAADTRSDVYSLGCTLFFLLTGRAPYDGSSPERKLFAHREHPISDLREIREDVPSSLSELFQKMVAKNPDDRLQDMTSVIEALQSIEIQETRRPEEKEHPSQLLDSSTPPNPEGDGTPSNGGTIADVVKQEAASRRHRIGQLTRWLLLMILPIVAGALIVIKTRSGRLIVEIDPADFTVVVEDKNGKVEITRRGGQDKVTLTVEPGEHRIKVTKEGFTAYAEEFQMTWWGRHTIKAKLEPLSATASTDAAIVRDPEFVSWLRDVQSLSAEKQLSAVSRKLVERNPGFDGSLVWAITNEPPRIENGVVTGMQLSTASLSDISPLRALVGLQDLNLNSGILADLSPLQGLRLKKLNVAQNQGVRNLSPLRGMPLQFLNLQGTGVTDLSPIRDLPLEELSLRETSVTDLEPLKGMRLITLDCHRTQISDLSCLEGMPLRSFSAPANTSGLEAIRNLRLTTFEIESRTCFDLSPIQEMPLERLSLLLPMVSDLKPLAGMKLIEVTLTSDAVTDLTPLVGMPLEKLSLDATSVTDISPLKDLPLIRISISVAADANLEVLRSIRTLQFINDKPAEQYWSEFGKCTP
ncbi:MAG: protein kinase [Planctomycetaceae bacterium]